MSEIGDWIQLYWFELGSLLVQFGVLVTLAWYGRKALHILAVAHEPEKSVQPAARVQQAARVQPIARRFAIWESVVRYAISGARSIGRALAAAWRSVINWLLTPSSGMAPWRRFYRWFQAPIRS